MRAKRYFLKGNKGTEAPDNLLFFDTESHYKGERPSSGCTVHTLKLWTAIACRFDGERITREVREHGNDTESFWQFVQTRQQKSKPLWAFAHNLGFDLTLTDFWTQLEHGAYTVGPIPRPPSKKTGKPRKPWCGKMCLEGRPTFAIVQGAVGKVRFVDTGNYWPTKLEAIGTKFGLPKLSIDFATCTDEQLLEYCFRDSQICQYAICDLIRQWRREDSGVFQMTAASLSLTNWRHTCDVRTSDGECVNVLMEPGHEATALERDGYYGGRVEPFFVGKVEERVYSLDVNSLYLGVMSSELYPNARVKKFHNCTPTDLLKRMSAYGAVADVCIKSRTDTYPTRPHGVQLHACGHFHTTLCGPELLRALKNGHVVSVGECWLYSLAPLFKSWANYWYAKKAEAQAGTDANEADAEFAKLIGNSLSGKFGQRGEFWKDDPEYPCKALWGEWTEIDYEEQVTRRFRGIAGKTQERVAGHEPQHSFPLISAYITSYAREYMRMLFSICPPESIYYSATDSIICNHEAYSALENAGRIHPTNLGALKVKGVYHSASIYGCNWYQLDDWVVRSGSVAKLKPADDGTPTADLWQQLPSIIGNRPNGSVIVSHVRVQGFDPTPKGIRLPSGWVRPFTLTPDPDFTDRPRPRRSNTPT